MRTIVLTTLVLLLAASPAFAENKLIRKEPGPEHCDLFVSDRLGTRIVHGFETWRKDSRGVVYYSPCEFIGKDYGAINGPRMPAKYEDMVNTTGAHKTTKIENTVVKGGKIYLR
ncbi:MAG: hypothetical protein V4436_03705 [Patescibacteria group bacterium]